MKLRYRIGCRLTISECMMLHGVVLLRNIYLTNGSHGCINLPYENAKIIYEYVYTGFRWCVIIKVGKLRVGWR